MFGPYAHTQLRFSEMALRRWLMRCELEILRLRGEYPGVPLRRCHDLLLSFGTVPSKVVQRELAAKAGNRWGARQAAE